MNCDDLRRIPLAPDSRLPEKNVSEDGNSIVVKEFMFHFISFDL